MKIKTIQQEDVSAKIIAQWTNGLWYPDFEEAGIEICYVVFDESLPIAYQTINIDGLCIALEVKPDYQGKGIATMLIEESGCSKPERNENKEFWSVIAEKFGE